MTGQDAPRVALFVTCLADMFRPQVGFAAAKLLEQAGCKVEVPVQSCCGQPAYNGGDAMAAAAVARTVIATFEPYDFVVAPSGSCAGMIRVHYPRLFQDDDVWGKRADSLAKKTHE
jgi:L-lactate dehydrogenase complex protein LldE